MPHEVENKMVLDSHWRHLEDHRTIIGECSGCEENIYSNEQWLDMVLNGEQVLVHQDEKCCYQFVADISICRGGDEE
jgi:extradiol dioxygenase family protein